MKLPEPAPKRVIYTSGTFDSSSNKQSILDKLVSTRRFLQQIDVVFPLHPDSDLHTKLKSLTTSYRRRQWKLFEFIRFATLLPQSTSSGSHRDEETSSMVAVGLPGPTDNDSWCFDGETLVISMGKDSWQKFAHGEGARLPWKEHQDTKTFRFSLTQLRERSPKLEASFAAWDERRGPWDVVYSQNTTDAVDSNDTEEHIHPVEPVTRIARNVHVHVPSSALRSQPADKEDWEDKVSALFEWIGMACLGSQRLQLSDNPDPYISVYEPPDGSHVGDVAHIRWKGLVSRPLLRSIFDAILADASVPLVSVTGHAVFQSPVTYSGTVKQQRAPDVDSEDTWSLVLLRSQADGVQSTSWVLGESVGKWDSRLG